MYVFVNQAGLKYAAETAANPNDSLIPFTNQEMIDILVACGMPMNDENLQAAINQLQNATDDEKAAFYAQLEAQRAP